MLTHTKVRESHHDLLLISLILNHSITWVSWRWKFFRLIRLQYNDLLKAKGVHNELKACGVELKKFSWQWYLCIDLRKHLNSQISDALVARVIADFEIYERNRLHGEFAVLGKPGIFQFMTTINSLNSTAKELNFWLESGYNQLQEELMKRMEDCMSNLGAIARQSISGVWLDYKELEKHSFYFTAMRVLLQEFQKRLSHIPKREESLDIHLDLQDHAVFFYLFHPLKSKIRGGEQKNQFEYLKTHQLPSDDKTAENFSRYIRSLRKPRKLSTSQIANKLKQVEKLEPLLSKDPLASQALEKLKNSYLDQLTDNE